MAATHHLLHTGYARDDGVASSVSLVLDGEATIVVDPGMVADRGLILDPLRALGVEPEQVTHVVITHHHPDQGRSHCARTWGAVSQRRIPRLTEGQLAARASPEVR
jgi:ribonuclease BN (tRNA processing enzyme)